MQKLIQSLYIHFPFCKSICNYCDFYKKPLEEGESFSQFHDLLSESFMLHENLLRRYDQKWGALESLYFGGGTPSLWGNKGPIEMQKLFDEYGITLSPTCEATLEVNPDSFSDETLKKWQEFGVNRFSLGVQSLDSRYSKILDRAHTTEDALKALEYFHKNDLNFSVDFMLGLPFSKDWNRDIIRELEECLKYNPKHFSIYILTVKGEYKYYNDLPDEQWIEKEFLDVSNYLRSRGYLHYEVSNFSKEGLHSRHNMSYWDHDSVAAIGPSGTGFFNLGDKGFRYKWNPTKASFNEEILDKSQMDLESLYLSLRTFKGHSYKDDWSDLYSSWKERGLVEITAQKSVHLTPRGYLVLDSLMDEIFSAKKLP